ncbi:hypothetical protein ESN35_06445 [Bifidobacterium pullorum subsp. gallinarum]|uniref:Phage protein n=1 Tax=Bifidobacterium pullorum subsp. gallinarum TaxID=78344 RepID=A0A4P6E4F2_9BIFI|nr:hypothetical protein [Bifidobacterium pullorum]QAY33079.1 hypothetical protein ESN35_06445 [Bifidobacterium pullorum subsp. gallinarum]
MTEIIIAIVTSVIGSGGFWAFLQWRLDRRRRTVLRDELAGLVERALADSPTIRDVEAKLDRDFKRLERQEEWNARHDEEMRQNRLVSLRQCLFAHPRDRNAHESALESGREYIAMGGNGTGHIRLEQLEDDYRRRLEADDWDYSERRP